MDDQGLISSRNRGIDEPWISETAAWASVLVFGAGLLWLAFQGTEPAGTLVLLVLGFGVVATIAHLVAGEADRRWLPGAVMAAFAAKMIGAGLRYWVLIDVYRGAGDAGGYHRAGVLGAPIWRSFSIPPPGAGSAGTHFVNRVTGLIYVPYEPSMLGGFFIFATLAFLGQVAFYLAFRRISRSEWLPWYGAAIFFLPSMIFWPSSIGKESLMLLFLGIGAYGAVRLRSEYRIRWLVVLAAGLAGAAGIRVHIAALLAVGAAVSFAVGGSEKSRWIRRLALLGLAVGMVWFSVGQVTSEFGIGERGEQLEPFIESLERNTSQGGSAVQGRPIDDPSDLPQGVLRVLFRPLPNEAHNLQALASAAESTLLLVLIVWNLPRMLRHISRLRAVPYLLLSLTFVGGFVIGFSPILNLGILARQRTQALPFLLAALVGLSVRARDTDLEQESPPVRISSLSG